MFITGAFPKTFTKKQAQKKAPSIAVTGGAFTRQRSFYRQDDES
ncbi:hypothetical protein ECSTEC7V_2617 [Escherichia coli STEC_7v]|nr:hypothetical protein ECSTEC7V_2617 [Escherichia coli STEC_7v]